jgi:hypothetical protein
LLAGAGGVFIDLGVVGGAREDGVLVIEGTVFAINCDEHVGGQVKVLEFGDRAAVFHVGCVATCAEYAADSHGLVCVGRGDEGTGGVVDDSSEGNGEVLLSSQLEVILPQYHRAYLLLQGRLELRNNVKALHAVNVEAFGPSL